MPRKRSTPPGKPLVRPEAKRSRTNTTRSPPVANPVHLSDTQKLDVIYNNVNKFVNQLNSIEEQVDELDKAVQSIGVAIE